jgi:proline dehydrogenase
MSPSGSLHDAPERALRSLFMGLSHRRSLGRLAVRVPITRPMVARFVAGETLPEVLGALEPLRDAGFMTTVDVLGESVSSAEACALAAARYEETLAALAGHGVDRNVSLKLTQMGLDISEEICRETVARVMLAAVGVGAFVRIDMEDHAKTDRTLGIWRELRSINPETGVVIQAALRRSAPDVEALIAEGARVRLCMTGGSSDACSASPSGQGSRRTATSSRCSTAFAAISRRSCCVAASASASMCRTGRSGTRISCGASPRSPPTWHSSCAAC